VQYDCCHFSQMLRATCQNDPSLVEDPKKKGAVRRKKNLPTTLTPGKALLYIQKGPWAELVCHPALPHGS
jgi:hypothetical protein